MSRSVSGVLPLDEAKRPTTILAPPLSLEPLPGTPIRPPPPLQQVAGLREAAILCHLLLLALCLSVCVWDHKQKIQAGRQGGGARGLWLPGLPSSLLLHTHTHRPNKFDKRNTRRLHHTNCRKMVARKTLDTRTTPSLSFRRLFSFFLSPLPGDDELAK